MTAHSVRWESKETAMQRKVAVEATMPVEVIISVEVVGEDEH